MGLLSSKTLHSSSLSTLSMKFIIVGPLYSGKTSIWSRMIVGTMPNYYKVTKTASVGCKQVKLEKGEILQYEIWDVPSVTILPMHDLFLKDVDGVFIVAENGTIASMDCVKEWVQHVEKYSNSVNEQRKPIVFLASKCDSSNGWIDKEEVQELAASFKINYSFLVSSLFDMNLDAAINCMVRLVISHRIHLNEDLPAEPSNDKALAISLNA